MPVEPGEQALNQRVVGEHVPLKGAEWAWPPQTTSLGRS
jgi:hypothetical protein